ncbi:TRAP transporter substrate-binding protein, partial [uncultured Desulfovibrio sp.]
MKRCSLLLCALAVLVLCVGTADAEEYKKQTIRAATANPEGSQMTTAINKFKEIVERDSNGQITVQTFYGGSMGDEQANVKQLRNNEINLGVMSTGNLTPFAPSAGIFYLPYLFPTTDDAKKLLRDEEFSKKLADQIARESRTRPLGWLLGGYRVLTNSKHPINTIDDLKGLKMRVPPVEMQLAAFRSWGVEPHPLAWSETFNGLQQGVIDGQENPHAVNRDQKFWEVQKYITDVPYLLWTGPFLVSEQWYRKLDPKTRALVDRAAREALEHEWNWIAEQEQLALRQCEEHGMVKGTPTDLPKWEKQARST